VIRALAVLQEMTPKQPLASLDPLPLMVATISILSLDPSDVQVFRPCVSKVQEVYSSSI
jgi:hypothetical protein